MRLGNTGASVTATALEDGVWVPTPFGDLRVRLRHPDSAAYRRAIRNRRAIFEAAEDDVLREDAIRRAIAEAAIVDMDGAADTDGNAVAYSPETLVAIIENPDNRPFVDWVASTVVDLIPVSKFEAVLKNFGSASPTD